MKVIYNLSPSESETFTALGFFDGIHLGHTDVIEETVRGAQRLGVKSCVFTFSRRPKSVLTGEPDMLLTTDHEKRALIERAGVDILYIVDFSEVMDMSGEEFVKTVLIDKLKCRGVVCGFNYCFGKGGGADADTLADICGRLNCEVIVRDPIIYKADAIGSSRIRNALQSGDIQSANDMLGRRYGYSLKVVHGRQLGRTIGIPTINQAFPEDFCLPMFGAYASLVTVEGVEYRGITNIGVKPTVGSDKPVSETWILGFSGDLYGKIVDVRLVSFIRGEKKFASVDELKKQILADASRHI